METLAFTDLIIDRTKDGTKLPTNDYKSIGSTAIIDQGQEFIAGYTDKPDGVFTDVPAIIFGDHTRVFKYVDFPFFLGADGVKILKANRELNYKYLYYYFLQAKFPNTGYARHFKWLKELQIPLPPLVEQKHIAAVLDKCTELIAKNKQMLEKYDTLIKSRFIEMFGDIIQNSKNWKIYSFTDIAKSRLGKMLDSKKQTGKEKYPYLANFNVQWFHFNLENLNEMDFSKEDRIEFRLQEGDLLVCEGGEVGRCAVWHNQIENCFFQKAVHRIRLNKDIVQPDYMAFWFKTRSDFNSFDDVVGSKATIAHLTGEKLKTLQIPIPPIELQNDFAAFVQQTDGIKSAVQKSLEKAETLYKSLMQTYFG